MDDKLNEMKRPREAELEHENNKLRRKIEELENKLKEEHNDKMKAIEDLKDRDKKIKAKSLYEVLRGTDLIKKLSFRGSSSHLSPQNHIAAKVSSKAFRKPDMIRIVNDLKTRTSKDPMLEEETSQLILKFINNQNIPTDSAVQVESPTCHSEAEVAYYVNLLLDDVKTICNAIVSMIPSTAKPAQLVVRQEMSIFSNRCDHAVVFDVTSNVPIFCVETKSYFDKKLNNATKHRAFGQCFDQLNAMRLLGQLRPFGALTCFNETYLTSLDVIDDVNASWDIVPTLKSLQATVDGIPRKELPDTTPSPLKVEQQAITLTGVGDASYEGFVQSDERHIVRSECYFDHKCLVSTFVAIILHALNGNYEPKPFQKYTERARIHDYCLKMEEDSYQWGKLLTTYRGPYRSPFCFSSLYLLRCIGTGATSKAYYAMTENGYDCVVKLYVQRHHEDGTKKTNKEFVSDSITHVTNEVNHYNAIYEELKDYVWQQKLNGMDCIIMPFFHPIDMRENELPIIEDRLKLFTERNLAFKECDQCWRHIGSFNGKLYLFDLGDLITCKSQAAAQRCASIHLKSLKARMNRSEQNQNS